MKHYVYIIASTAHPEQYYVGMTNDVESRLKDHNSGKSSHTAKYKPWCLVFHCWFDDAAKASEFEKYLKSGSGRAFAAKRLR
jgi:predicted GIY-YIG superfamily endonuclease